MKINEKYKQFFNQAVDNFLPIIKTLKYSKPNHECLLIREFTVVLDELAETFAYIPGWKTMSNLVGHAAIVLTKIKRMDVFVEAFMDITDKTHWKTDNILLRDDEPQATSFFHGVYDSDRSVWEFEIY